MKQRILPSVEPISLHDIFAMLADNKAELFFSKDALMSISKATKKDLKYGKKHMDALLGAAFDARIRRTMITSATNDSRAVRKGDLYFAMPGANVHGAIFAPQAIKSGAVAIVTDDEGLEILEVSNAVKEIPVVTVPEQNIRLDMAFLSSIIYANPSDDMTMFAVTGTNGKTTVVYIIEKLLELLGKKPGIMGTVENRAGKQTFSSWLTTPDSPDVQAILAKMRGEKVTDVAMEVSSHALVLDRTIPIHFDVSGWTNLTRDHLDFHNTMEEYCDAKMFLFDNVNSKKGVINIDGEYTAKAFKDKRVREISKTLSFKDDKADYFGFGVEVFKSASGGSLQSFLLRDNGDELKVTTNLIGDYNAENIALAIAMVSEQYGFESVKHVIDKEVADRGYIDISIPGRFERIEVKSDGSTKRAKELPTVIVDYAHNPDGMEKLLKASKELLGNAETSELVIVFGAPGKRDTEKRPIMGEIAVKYADKVIITDDEPHNDNAAEIRAMVLDGAKAYIPKHPKKSVKLVEIASRKEAIEQSIKEAKSGDVVVLAGRGHETTQEIDGKIVEIDDRVVARGALERMASD